MRLDNFNSPSVPGADTASNCVCCLPFAEDSVRMYGYVDCLHMLEADIHLPVTWFTIGIVSTLHGGKPIKREIMS